MSRPPRNNGDKTAGIGRGKPPVSVATQFKAGNPGRPKGSRSKLGEQFIQDLYADWHAYGIKVLEKVREDRPHEYLKVVASLLPKQLDVQVSEYERHTDDELRDELIKEAAVLGIVFEESETEH